jgi:SAM-dependent methyltransferase
LKPKPVEQHQIEIQRSRDARAAKPLIRRIYGDFYDRILAEVKHGIDGAVVEIGAGSGELKSRFPNAICTDLFANPWLDLVCDAYALPFAPASVSNLILLDVFHHLERPLAFTIEAARVLAPHGRLILFEPYISPASFVIYGCFHHEPVAWNKEIDLGPAPPRDQRYYAAQGNATRLFFRAANWLPPTMRLLSARAHADFAYLLSGGLSKPSVYPASFHSALRSVDERLSGFPRAFAGRCLVVLERE